MIILIDTGPLVALCDSHDQKHASAVRHLGMLRASEFAVCEAVLTEACFHLPHGSQRRRLRALLEDLEIQPIPLTNESALWREVFEWLAKYTEHQPDWADGCLAVLSAHRRNAKVWTYDREFRTIWRRPNGTVIPLAVKSF
jgi:predicted nucleic acid-binding protein